MISGLEVGVFKDSDIMMLAETLLEKRDWSALSLSSYDTEYTEGLEKTPHKQVNHIIAREKEDVPALLSYAPLFDVTDSK